MTDFHSLTTFNAAHADPALRDGEHHEFDQDLALAGLMQEFAIANENIQDHYKMPAMLL